MIPRLSANLIFSRSTSLPSIRFYGEDIINNRTFIRSALPEPGTDEYNAFLDNMSKYQDSLDAETKKKQALIVEKVESLVSEGKYQDALQAIADGRLNDNVITNSQMYEPIIKATLDNNMIDEAHGLYQCMLNEDPYPLIPSKEIVQALHKSTKDFRDVRPEVY